jgi:hypothetical protein
MLFPLTDNHQRYEKDMDEPVEIIKTYFMATLVNRAYFRFTVLSPQLFRS